MVNRAVLSSSCQRPLHRAWSAEGSPLARRSFSACYSLGNCTGSHHHHHQSLNREGRWGTTDDFATSFLHFSLFSTALWDLLNSRPVHSLMLSSHLFLCPPCLLPPFTVPCKMVLARPDEWGHMTIPLQFASLYDRQEIFMWSNCLLDLGTDFLVGNMVFV